MNHEHTYADYLDHSGLYCMKCIIWVRDRTNVFQYEQIVSTKLPYKYKTMFVFLSVVDN